MVVKVNLKTHLERRKTCGKWAPFFLQGASAQISYALFYLPSGVCFFDEKEKWKAYNPIYGWKALWKGYPMVVKEKLMTQLERRKKCDKLHLFFCARKYFADKISFTPFTYRKFNGVRQAILLNSWKVSFYMAEKLFLWPFQCRKKQILELKWDWAKCKWLDEIGVNFGNFRQFFIFWFSKYSAVLSLTRPHFNSKVCFFRHWNGLRKSFPAI